MKITVGQITDKGLNPRRTNNEDSLLALPELGLFLVADGVGGRLGGEVASRTVVDIFARVFAQTRDQHDGRDLRDLLADTIELCNQKVFDDARANDELDGMATTLALVAVDGERAVIAHVGDSRVYRYDEQGLIPVTDDHSEVNDQLRAGIITPEQAARHPRRNVISRAIGAEPEVQADFREIEIDEFTSFILCTDGITLHVTDAELARLLKSGQAPQVICDRLKDLCYQGGAEDNLTAIVVDLGARARFGQTEAAPTDDRAEATTLEQPLPGAPARIEFNLRPEPKAEAQLEAGVAESPPYEPAQKQTAQLRLPPDAQAAANLQSSPDLRLMMESSATTASAPRAGHAPSAASGVARPPRPARRSITINLPELQIPTPSALEEGELPTAMKIILLVIALAVGLVSGLVLGKYLGRGDVFTDASPATKNVVQPSDPEVNAAYARFLENKPEEARSQLNAALTAKPSNAEAHYYLGMIDYAQSRYDEAINHLAQAAKLNPNLADVRIRLAMAYISIGQPRNAKDVLQQAVGPAPKPNAAGAAPTTASPAASPTPAG